MGVVHNGKRRLRPCDALQSSDRRVQRFERATDRFHVKAEAQRDPRGAQEIAHVKATEHPGGDFMALSLPAQRKAHAAFVVRDACGGKHFASVHNAIFVEARCNRAHAALKRPDDETATGRIVGVDHRGFQSRPVEEHRFGRFIGLRGLVVVQMVAREIGKDSRFDGRAVKAMTHETDGTCFERKSLCLSALELFKGQLECCRIGRRKPCFLDLPAVETCADRTDRRRAHAQSRKERRHPVARARLAVGARDRDAVHGL